MEDRHTNQINNSYQDAELDSEASGDTISIGNVETGFHILASMIAEYHMRQKDSDKSSPSDRKPDNPPH